MRHSTVILMCKIILEPHDRFSEDLSPPQEWAAAALFAPLCPRPIESGGNLTWIRPIRFPRVGLWNWGSRPLGFCCLHELWAFKPQWLWGSFHYISRKAEWLRSPFCDGDAKSYINNGSRRENGHHRCNLTYGGRENSISAQGGSALYIYTACAGSNTTVPGRPQRHLLATAIPDVRRLQQGIGRD